jgi:TetR/AcrR family tetracycline transcriptional repressor
MTGARLIGKYEGSAKAGLSRELICAAALEAIDEAGVEAMSMRRLASSLGVKASSLYHHFGSRDELMRAVVESLFQELGPPPDGHDWQDQVKRSFIQLDDFIGDHPNAAPLLLRSLASSSVPATRADALQILVQEAGFDQRESADMLVNLAALLAGHVLLSDGSSGGAAFSAGMDALIRGFLPHAPGAHAIRP